MLHFATSYTGASNAVEAAGEFDYEEELEHVEVCVRYLLEGSR